MGKTSLKYVPPPELVDMPLTQLQEIVYRNDPTLRCRQGDADKFFSSRSAEYARNLCGGCPIRAECGELALREEMHGYFQGIRGGMSPGERRTLVRLRKQAAKDAKRPAA